MDFKQLFDSCGIKFPKCEKVRYGVTSIKLLAMILLVLGSRDQWTQLAYVKFVAWVV